MLRKLLGTALLAVVACVGIANAAFPGTWTFTGPITNLNDTVQLRCDQGQSQAEVEIFATTGPGPTPTPVATGTPTAGPTSTPGPWSSSSTATISASIFWK